LVAPQSFPHLWKKLWKFHQIRGSAGVLRNAFEDFLSNYVQLGE
jgi:hypothetical protein